MLFFHMLFSVGGEGNEQASFLQTLFADAIHIHFPSPLLAFKLRATILFFYFRAKPYIIFRIRAVNFLHPQKFSPQIFNPKPKQIFENVKIEYESAIHKLYVFSMTLSVKLKAKSIRKTGRPLRSLRKWLVKYWPKFRLEWRLRIGPMLGVECGRKMFCFCFCHRRKDRSITLFGYTFPLCARCSGLVFGLVLGLCFFLAHTPFPTFFSVTLVFPLVLDGGLQYLGYRNSNNLTRFITGVMFVIGSTELLASFVS